TRDPGAPRTPTPDKCSRAPSSSAQSTHRTCSCRLRSYSAVSCEHLLMQTCIIPARRAPMILVEHAVVVTMDAERRIFMDGSVLIDGERIVQVGRAADVQPPHALARV